MKRIHLIRPASLVGLSVIAGLLLVGCGRSPIEKQAQFLESGRRLLAAKDYKRAILEFRNAVEVRQGSSEAHYQLGLAYLAVGDWNLATLHLAKATELNPKHEGAQVRLSELLATSDDPAVLAEGRKRLEQVFRNSAGNADALTALAMTEWKLSDPELAEKHLFEAAALAKDGNMAPASALAQLRISQGKLDEAEAILTKAAAAQPTAASHILLGQFFVGRERLPEATQQFELALKADKNHPAALLYLAAVHTRAGRTGAAGDMYKRLAALPDPAYRPVHALFLFRAGRKDEAISELRKLMQANPADVAIRNHLLSSLLWSNRLPDAERLLNEVIENNSSDTQVLVQRAALYIAQERYDGAQQDLERVLYLQASSPQAHYLLARLHEARGRPLSQQQSLGEALRLDRKLLPARLDLAMLLIRRNAARTALQVIEETPAEQKNLSTVILQRNWALMALGRTAEIERSLETELKLSSDPETSILKAMLGLQRGQNGVARQHARAALKHDPEDVRPLEIISRSYAAENNREGAFSELASFAAARPSDAGVHQFMGSVLVSYGMREEARAAFSKALSLKPANVEAKLSLIQLDVTGGKLDQARTALNEVLSQGENIQALQWLGQIEQIQGNADRAAVHYRKILAADPNHVRALNNLSYLLAEKEPDQALPLAQKAAELAPNDPSVHNTLGWIFYCKGLYRMAVPYLEKAFTSESNATRNYHLGLAYLKTGDTVRGTRTLQALRRDYPNSAEARRAGEMVRQ